MHEVLTAAAANLSPKMLMGNAALALALIPTQYLVDLGKNKIQDFVDAVLPHYPERVFYDAFLKTLKDHKERHDHVAERITEQLIRQLKHDKERFYHCVNTLQVSQNLSNPLEPFPALLFADKLIEEYHLDLTTEGQTILHAILRDCMDDYRQAIYQSMNEKGLLLQVLQTLMDLQDQAALFEALLSNAATRSDMMILKNALLTAMRQRDTSKWQEKSLVEYDQMIRSQYCYIEFTAGFSPRINARDIRMKMSDVFINLECVNQGSTGPASKCKGDFDLEATVLYSRFNVFLGDPGCGKTTLLKKIAFDLSSPENRSGGTLSNFIPLYFRLAEYSRFYQDTHKGIAEYLQQTFYQHKKSLFDIAQCERSLVFLMDGLDEITDTPLRIHVVDQVNIFVFANAQYIYFITSRIVGYRDAALNGIFTTYRLEPLSNDKIRSFVYQWHLAVEENTDDGKSIEDKQMAANKTTQNLIKAIEKNSSVKRLATNPLLLTIITLIHLQGGRLPNKRVELYEVCAETFLQHWINRRVENADAILDRDILIELLSRVAFYIHENYANGLIPEDDFQQKFLVYYQELSGGRWHSLTELKKECRQFIDFIRKETGIFAEKGQDESGKNLFGFLHLTFEEYFAAIEFKRRVAQSSLPLKDYIPSARWREIILLCAALFGGQSGDGRYEASKFVKKILRAKELFPPMHQNLRLALSIMADDIRLLTECEQDIWARLEAVLQEDSELRLHEELEALLSSAEYREWLRKKVEQWLNCDGMLYINTVRWLLCCKDSPWDDFLLAVPDTPNFAHFLEWFALHSVWPYFRGDTALIEKWMNGIAAYLNEGTADHEVRWRLLMHLGDFADRFHQKLDAPLSSKADQLALEVYLFVQRIPQRFHYSCGGSGTEQALRQMIDKASLPLNSTPRIVIHHEILNMAGRVSSIRYTCRVLQGSRHYHILVITGFEKLLYEYIILDAYLEEIQVGIYNAPLSADQFVETFGLEAKGVRLDDPWLNRLMGHRAYPTPAAFLQAWEEGLFGDWNDLLFMENVFTSEEESAFVSSVHQWIRLHGQDAPIHLLLAQIILNRFDTTKNYVTLTAIKNAVSCYMKGQMAERQQRDAYNIIERAIQSQLPHTKQSKKSAIQF